jgi:hypothetical protein
MGQAVGTLQGSTHLKLGEVAGDEVAPSSSFSISPGELAVVLRGVVGGEDANIVFQ